MYNDDKVLGHSSGARPAHLSDQTVLAIEKLHTKSTTDIYPF